MPQAACDERLALALQHLASAALLHHSAITACLEAFDHSHPAEAHWAPQATALAMAQLVPLLHTLQNRCLEQAATSPALP